MSKRSAIIGVSDHAGWAALVSVTQDGTLLDRRRIRLVDADLPSFAYHHGAQGLPIEEGVALVERVRVCAEQHAKVGLESLANELAAPIRGIALRECPKLPATPAERIQSYWAQTRADGVMYRKALAAAAEARGWVVHWYDAKKVLDALSEAHFLRMKKSIGPPWGKDQKVAMAAAIAAAR